MSYIPSKTVNKMKKVHRRDPDTSATLLEHACDVPASNNTPWSCELAQYEAFGSGEIFVHCMELQDYVVNKTD